MYKLIADSSFSWEYIRENDGFSYVSPSCARMTGYAPEEFLARPRLLEEIVHPSDREAFEEHLHGASRAEEPVRLKLRLTCRNGRDCWVEHAVRQVHDAQEQYVGLRGSFRDITAHRQALTDLQDSEERFRTFMSHLPALAFIKDERSRILFTNRAMNELMGSEDWIGRNALENLPGEVAAKIMEQDRGVIEGGKPVLIEEAIPVKSGETRIFETRKFPIGREGKPPLLGAIALDVTEKRRAEEALLASEERYRRLAEASRDFIFVLDRDDRFVYVNGASETVTGKRPAELIGRPRASLDVPPEMLGRQKEANDTVFATGEPLFVEGQYLMGKGGRPAWHNVTLVPLKDGGGEVHALLGVARDVTESRERAQRLEEVNVALKVLLRHRDEDRRELEEQFLANFRKLIMPSLEKLRKTGLTPRQAAYVDVVEMNVRKVFSASGAAAGLAQASLTPIEMRIVEFIKDDKTTKEIGSLLNLSPRTVEYYRDRIRKKLGLKSKNVNLRSYLYSLS